MFNKNYNSFAISCQDLDSPQKLKNVMLQLWKEWNISLEDKTQRINSRASGPLRVNKKRSITCKCLTISRECRSYITCSRLTISRECKRTAYFSFSTTAFRLSLTQLLKQIKSYVQCSMFYIKLVGEKFFVRERCFCTQVIWEFRWAKIWFENNVHKQKSVWLLSQ